MSILFTVEAMPKGKEGGMAMLPGQLQTFVTRMTEELHKGKYHLSKETLEQMDCLRQQYLLKIIRKEEAAEFLSLPLYTYDGNCLCKLKTRAFPQVTEHLPVWKDGRFAFVKPYVVLIEGEPYDSSMESIMVHEICHLLSIGTYRFQGQVVYHRMGLNFFELAVDRENACMTVTNKTGQYEKNELVNDFVASILYRIVMPDGNYVFQKGACTFAEDIQRKRKIYRITEEQAVRAYFEGEWNRLFP